MIILMSLFMVCAVVNVYLFIAGGEDIESEDGLLLLNLIPGLNMLVTAELIHQHRIRSRRSK